MEIENRDQNVVNKSVLLIPSTSIAPETPIPLKSAAPNALIPSTSAAPKTNPVFISSEDLRLFPKAPLRKNLVKKTEKAKLGSLPILQKKKKLKAKNKSFENPKTKY